MIPVKSLLIGGAALSLFSFFKGKQSANKDTDTGADTVRDAGKDVNKANVKHSDSWFSLAADLIQENIQKAYRSNYSLHSVLIKLAELKNKDEYLYLIKKFGLRSGWSWGVVYKESLNKWLLFFLESRTYNYKKDGVNKSANALQVAKFILKKRGVNLV